MRQYDFLDGFAKPVREALPKASFIGFTGTPIESGDKNTQAVFGAYIDVYDILQAKEDLAAVPIYYEARDDPVSALPDGIRMHITDERTRFGGSFHFSIAPVVSPT